MNILVLGAGVIGTATAWYLQRAGHRVTVLERQLGAALETSYANGGQISVSHAEPWANLRALPKILHWIGREDAPLRFCWRIDPALWAWSLRFLRECAPHRTQANIGAIVSLALHSRTCLRTLRQELQLDYNHLERGILHIYTDPQEFSAAQATARLMADLGVHRYPVDVQRCIEIEPALSSTRSLLVGGDYTPDDESGDAHQFTRQLAEKAAQAGVEFRYNTLVTRLITEHDTITGVETSPVGSTCKSPTSEHTLIKADAYVLALGSESPLLLRPLGIHVPIYPAKGYSATLPLGPQSVAPIVSLTDDEHKLVFSRLGQHLRIAGTAEFNGYNPHLNPIRCQALMQRAHQLFPQLNPTGEPLFWCGLRPATPSNLPCIGRPSRYRNLWLNTGHGTLGWTLACGSAHALTDLIEGRPPAADFPFLS